MAGRIVNTFSQRRCLSSVAKLGFDKPKAAKEKKDEVMSTPRRMAAGK